jgi:hypothetical protein
MSTLQARWELLTYALYVIAPHRLIAFSRKWERDHEDGTDDQFPAAPKAAANASGVRIHDQMAGGS